MLTAACLTIIALVPSLDQRRHHDAGDVNWEPRIRMVAMIVVAVVLNWSVVVG